MELVDGKLIMIVNKYQNNYYNHLKTNNYIFAVKIIVMIINVGLKVVYKLVNKYIIYYNKIYYK